MIVLDVGNTHVRSARATPGPLRRPDAMALTTLLHRPTPRTADATAALLSDLRALRRPQEVAALVSVVPDLTAALMEAWPDLAVADHRTDLPFALDLEDPSAVGADRYANLAAAAAMGWTSALVVDAGTAVTYDVLEDGVFRGGLIAPGPAFAARALGEAAARLAPQPFIPEALGAGRGTAAAMRTGAWQQGLRGILGTVAALQAERPGRPLVLTGGLAPLLDHPSVGPAPPADAVRDPDWTLKGALLLAEGIPPCPRRGIR